MKNANLAKKIKELRVRHGFSQETLAYETNLGLRTVQRIENGESEPRGETLKRLSIALKTSPDELLDWSEQEDKGFLLLLGLSPLSFLIFPLLGIIAPLVLWIAKRNKIKGADTYGKKLLNFQITWSVVLFLAYLFFILAMFGVITIELDFLSSFDSLPIIVLFLGLYFINISFIVVNAILMFKSKNVWYPSVRLLK
ncbi:hypothetical protein GCM10009430_05740 [Aquimarina litoralis]|uniref:HTH cro/C1-type domain-containing protein n=1 Tax=Aquimarina litoralis TaxID=584605 RepID=A0ABN1IHH1_9FLAO